MLKCAVLSKISACALSLFVPNPLSGRRLNDPAHHPLCRAAQELDVPVAVHDSFGMKMPTLGQERYKEPFFFHVVCHPWEQQGACMDMICGGVLSQLPGLEVAFLESGAGWFGHRLDRMDSHCDTMGHYVPWLKRRPSGHFRARRFISMDPDESMLSNIAELGLEECVLWGSDYSHLACTFPGVVDEVRASWAKLPTHAQQKNHRRERQRPV